MKIPPPLASYSSSSSSPPPPPPLLPSSQLSMLAGLLLGAILGWVCASLAPGCRLGAMLHPKSGGAAKRSFDV